MSVRQALGSCLEGTVAVSFDVRAQARLLHRFGQQIDFAAEDLGQVVFQCDQTEQADMGLGVEFRCQIDIALRPCLAARRRTEQRQMPDAGAAQFLFAGSQRRDDRLRSERIRLRLSACCVIYRDNHYALYFDPA